MTGASYPRRLVVEPKGAHVPALLFLAFLVMPLVELWVILQVGELIGGWPTVLLLLVDSIAGAFIVRHEGRRAWTAFREAMAAGRWPADEVAQGALVLVGGALLLTPGFVTDAMGLAFVLPPTRALLARVIRSRVRAGAVQVIGFGGPGPRGASGRGGPVPPRGGPRTPPPGGSGEVLDVEVVSVERMSEPGVERVSEPGVERVSEPEAEQVDRRGEPGAEGDDEAGQA